MKAFTIAVPRISRVKRTVAFIPLDGYVDGEGWRVSLVTEDEAGHSPTGQWPCPPGGTRPWFWGHDYTQAVKTATDYNYKSLRITAKEAAKIVFTSVAASSRQWRSAAFTTFTACVSHAGEQDITAEVDDGGGLRLCGVGYYEDDITVPLRVLAALGLARTP